MFYIFTDLFNKTNHSVRMIYLGLRMKYVVKTISSVIIWNAYG